MKHLYLILSGLLFVGIAMAQNYTWGSLPVGGAGYVTGVITCADDPNNNIYVRTDVGGAYRWRESDKSWLPITDWLPENSASYMGVESMAIDPQSPNKVYMYCGTTYWNNGKSAILFSDDYGDTWTEKVIVTNFFPAFGNDLGRQSGERLAVDPNLGSVLLCGSRTRGLWKSTNSGSSWTRVANTTFTNSAKIAFVQFVPSSGTKGSATPTIYVGVLLKGANNLFVSNDNGATWAPVENQITNYMPHRCLLSNGKLYITYTDSEGPGTGGAGTIRKYELATGTWTNIAPASGSYGEVTVDPENPDYLMCTTVGMWQQQSWIPGADTYGDQIYISKNDGSTWTNLFPSKCTFSEPDIVWVKNKSQLHWAGSAKIDPKNRNRAYIISGNGLYATDNLWDTKPIWRMALKGLELTVPYDLVSLPGAPLVTVIGDYDGFIYHDITKYYPRHTPSMGSTSGLAIAGKNTQKMVRTGGDKKNAIYYTSNGGTLWTKITTEPVLDAAKGRCALSAMGNIIVWTPSGQLPYYSTDNGASWQVIPGISTNDVRFYGDYETDNVFYAQVSGQLRTYTYNTGTSTFEYSSVGLSGTMNNRLTVVPGISGEIWAPKGSNGLVRITNASTTSPTTTTLPINYASCIGVGKAAPNKTYPSLFIWGKPKSTDVIGLYRSDDEGLNWVRINDDKNQFGGPGNAQFVFGDMNVHGRVYMSTVGRGIIVGEMDTTSSVTSPKPKEKGIDIAATVFTNSVKISSSTACQYQIHSLTGRIEEAGTVNNEALIGQKLSPGVYILSATTANEKITIKIVKKR